jgi:putative redox protein
MADDPMREVRFRRLEKGRYEATNARGGTLVFGSLVDGDPAFTPVELLLTAIAGCTAADVDFIVSKRAEPSRLEVSMTAEKVRDADGIHLANLVVRFDVEFPAGDDGDAAREVVPAAIQRSHDYLCTVSRTVELGTPVQVVL